MLNSHSWYDVRVMCQAKVSGSVENGNYEMYISSSLYFQHGKQQTRINMSTLIIHRLCIRKCGL